MEQACNNNDIADLSFEEALRELETIVKKLETGKDSLEEAITSYERANLLRAHCDKKLTEAKLKVEQIIKQADGSVKTEEFQAG